MSISLRHPVLIASMLLLALAAFWPSLLSLHSRWIMSDEAYSHGYPVIALCIYVLWARRDRLLLSMSLPFYYALPFLMALSMLWLMASTVQVMVVQQMLLPMIALFWFICVFGWRVWRPVIMALGLAYLAIPLWDVLITPLRQITVFVVQGLLAIFNYPAFIDGFYITVPGGRFVVAGGCSGLNYLLTSWTLGLFYSLMYLPDIKRKLAFLAICTGFALLINWIRVFALVLIGYYTQMESSLVDDHETFGWVLFVIVLVPMFWIAGKLEKTSGKSPTEAVDTADVALPEVSSSHSKAAVFAFAATIVGPVLGLYVANQSASGTFELPVQNLRPAVETWMPKYKGYDRKLTFQDATQRWPGELTILYYDVQRQGKELVNDTNAIARERKTVKSTDVEITVGDEVFSVKEHIVQDEGSPRLVWSFYWLGDRPEIDDLTAKFSQLRGLFTGNYGAALVAFSARCSLRDCEDVRPDQREVAKRLLERWVN